MFTEYDHVDDWRLREGSIKTFVEFVEIVESHLDGIAGVRLPSIVWHQSSPLSPDLPQLTITDWRRDQLANSHDFLSRILSSAQKSKSHTELATSLFAAVVPTAAHWAQAVAHAVNFFLQDDQHVARAEIVALAKLDTREGNNKIAVYVREALRQSPIYTSIYILLIVILQVLILL